jgi:hypothetical protein
MIILLGLLFVAQILVSIAAVIGLVNLDVSQKVGVYTIGYEASVRKPFYIAVWRNL